jgi:hypothetical protein
MKEEILSYLKENENYLNDYIEEIINIIQNNITSTDPEIIVLMSLFEYIISEKTSKDFIKILTENFEIKEINILENLLTTEKENFLEIYKRIKNGINNQRISIVDLQWKFVGMMDINANDLRDMEPKIILKLIFSDDSIKLIETNFANLKKFQEELDDSLNSFNSVYSKRIVNFSK